MIVHNRWLQIGAGLMALAVVLGAFGAHGLKAVLDADGVAIWNKGVQYQVYHAFGVLVSAFLLQEGTGINWCGRMFVAGIVLFSGSLYVLAFKDVIAMNIGWVGPLTPLGGLCFIGGWIAMMVMARKKDF